MQHQKYKPFLSGKRGPSKRLSLFFKRTCEKVDCFYVTKYGSAFSLRNKQELRRIFHLERRAKGSLSNNLPDKPQSIRSQITQILRAGDPLYGGLGEGVYLYRDYY